VDFRFLFDFPKEIRVSREGLFCSGTETHGHIRLSGGVKFRSTVDEMHVWKEESRFVAFSFPISSPLPALKGA
jgi:hypothetical protein